MYWCVAPKLQLFAFSVSGSFQSPKVLNCAAALRTCFNSFDWVPQRVEELLVRNQRSSTSRHPASALSSHRNYVACHREILRQFDPSLQRAGSLKYFTAPQLAPARNQLPQRPMALARSSVCASLACNVPKQSTFEAPQKSMLGGGIDDSRTLLAGRQIPINLLPLASSSARTPAGRGGARRTLTVSNAKKGEVKAGSSKGSRASKRKSAAADEERVKVLAQRLGDLRQKMAEADGGRGVDALIVPSEDPHQSEYPAPCYARRAFVSGFTGTAGTAVVTKDEALLWTDGRYFLQAEQQLPPSWSLMRAGLPSTPSIPDWLAANLPAGARVGLDPFVHSAENVRSLSSTLSSSSSFVVPLMREPNLVDQVWGEQRPPLPCQPMRVHDLSLAGASVSSKLAAVRAKLQEAGATALLVAVLDEVAWLFNVRGSDIPHCPVTIAYALVSLDGACLFVDEGKLTAAVRDQLVEEGVVVKPYEDIVPALHSAALSGARLLADPNWVSSALLSAFDTACQDTVARLSHSHSPAQGGEGERAADPRGKAGKGGKGKDKERRKDKGFGKKGAKDGRVAAEGGNVVNDSEEGAGGSTVGGGDLSSDGASPSTPPSLPALICQSSPISLAKAVKNEAEIAGMKAAHIRDAAALAHFWQWLESSLAAGQPVSEVDVGRRLEECRAAQPGFVDTSFGTIAGSGKNGAIIHYQPEEGSCATVDPSKMLLVDSGGQYVDGTTDITRTVHFQTPSPFESECYTRVLQGHIAVDSAVFPISTPGFVLDVLARAPLWSLGLDYRHGTGHGVGAALNVHEGPHSISPRYGNPQGLLPGMVVSNEPGLYMDGSFGIRIENLLVVCEADTPNRFGGNTFCRFEPLTFFPIQTSLIDLSLMSDAEVQWMNEYHRQCWEKVSPLLTGEPLEWLRRNTQPISKPPAAPPLTAAAAAEPAAAAV